MDLASLLAQGVQPVKVADPMQSIGQVLQAATLARQGQALQYELQKKQRDDAAANSYNNALATLDYSNPDSVKSALQTSDPAARPLILKGYLDYQKNQAGVAKDTAEAQKNSATARKTTGDQISGIAGFYAGQPVTPDTVARAQATATKFGLDPKIFAVPDGVDPQQYYTSLAQGGIDAAKQADIANTKTGQGITMRGQDLTADAAKARTAEMANYHQGRIGVEQARLNAETTAGDGGMSDDAITNAAARYNIDGTLPPMGMGKLAAGTRAAILNRAADLAAQGGVNADDQRIAQLGNKANAAALQKLTQQQTMVGAFEKNFRLNADLALNMSQTVGNGGVPLVNQWLNAGKRAITGDPKLAAYDTAIDSTLKEYSKIVSGSMGNQAVAEGEINKARERLNAAQTPQQVADVINFMKKETDNRMAAFLQEQSQLRNSMRSGGSQVHEAAPAAAPSPPKLGDKVDGWTYRGGDPSQPSSWAK